LSAESLKYAKGITFQYAFCTQKAIDTLQKIMRKEDFQFMIEGMTSNLIQLLTKRKGMSMTITDAFDTVCQSKTYENLLNPATKLYFQSPRYVYSYLAEELSR